MTGGATDCGSYYRCKAQLCCYPCVSLKDVLHLPAPVDPPFPVNSALGSSASSLSFQRRECRQGHCLPHRDMVRKPPGPRPCSGGWQGPGIRRVWFSLVLGITTYYGGSNPSVLTTKSTPEQHTIYQQTSILNSEGHKGLCHMVFNFFIQFFKNIKIILAWGLHKEGSGNSSLALPNPVAQGR